MHDIKLHLFNELFLLHSLIETVTAMLELNVLLLHLNFKDILLELIPELIRCVLTISLPFADGFTSNLSLTNQSKAHQALPAQRVPEGPRVKTAEMEEM